MKLEIRKLSCGYDHRPIVKDVSLEIKSGEILCLLGPNGSGKTTFFKTILGLLKSLSGEILINNENIMNWTYSQKAKMIGYIPQAHNPPFPFKVLDVVLMGRTAHLGPFASPSEEDIKIARESIHTLNIDYLEDKVYTEISGGERQLVLVARALTQKPKILIMDEPTSNLDFGNQILVLNHVRRLAELGLAVIMASHSPDHAFFYATKVLTFTRKNQFYIGMPEKIVTEDILQEMYGVKVRLINIRRQDNSCIKCCIPYDV